ncbi:MAG: hypothetical protein UU78_C0005G0013, partial [Candidatus Roizmanbacteria bacterium GW2011_GWC2_41_7]
FNKTASLFSSLLYIIAPYRFLNMYVRGNVAEQWGLALLPFAFFFAEYSIRKKKFSIIPLSLILSLLILSHNITSLIGISLVTLYAIWRKYSSNEVRSLIRVNREVRSRILRDRTIINYVGSIVVALLLTSFFWLPVVIEAPQTKLSELSYDYRDFFPTVQEIVYSPWGFGPWKPGSIPGKMSPQIGVVHLLMGLCAAGIIAVKIVFKKKIQLSDQMTIVFLLIAIASAFLALPYSRFFWDHMPLLSSVQIPWRFVGYIVLGLSLCGGYIINSINRNTLKYGLFTFLIALLVYANRNHLRVNQYVDYQSPFSENKVIAMSTTSKDEHMPKKAPRIFEVPDQDGDIFPELAGTSTRIIWQSNYHMFNLDLESSAEFRDNTSYYPGWIAKIDGKDTAIQYEEDKFYRLRVSVPDGMHTVEFFLTEPWYRKLANITSVFTIIGLVSISVWERKKYSFS